MKPRTLPHLIRRPSQNRYWVRWLGAGIPLLILVAVGCVPSLVEPPTPFPASDTQLPPTQRTPTTPATSVAEEPTPAPDPMATEQVELPAQPVLEPRLEADQPVVIRQIAMNSARDGWAIGEHSNPESAIPIHVLRTADGGRIWREVTPPEDQSLMLDIGGAYFDGTNAWVHYAGTDRIWHTTNGGVTWFAAEAGYPMGALSRFEFSNPEHGWMLQEVESGLGSQLVALFRTMDGGESWQEIINPYESEDLQSCFKTGLSFFGTETGWVTYDCQGNYVEAFLDVSGDGGETWEEDQLPLPEGAAESTDRGWCYSGSPRLTSERSGSLIVKCVVAEGSVVTESSHLYRTEDAGKTWEIRDYPGGKPHFFGDGTMLALARDQYLSTDGGENWAKVKTVNWDGQYSFVDPNTGWAVATSEDEIALVATSDGGRTWEIVEAVIASE
ncbi:MAG: WD40/YVTN/BNR-like repeat-containing protein [Anaerolineales bacterium]